MKTSKRSLVRGAAFLALAAITAWGVAGTAMAGLSFRSGYVAVGEVSAVTPLAAPAEGGEESDAPVISGVAAEGVTDTGAIIVWTTDVLASSQVDYGPAPDYGSTATDPFYATIHSVTLEGLAPLTEYHYRAVSAGLFISGTAVSEDYTFTTLAPTDHAGPVISGVTCENVTASGAIIGWTTDEDADSQVQYGATANYGFSTTPDAILTKSHTVALTGLVYGTQYHYRVLSTDGAGNLAQSADGTFTTIDNMPPVISTVRVVDVETTSATVTWTTGEKADSQVEYGLEVTYGSVTAPDTALVTSHSVTITGLEPGTWYNCRVLSRDAAGNLAQSERREFLTSDDTPPVISGIILADITSAGATIRWETDEWSDGRVEYGVTANYGSSSTLDAALLHSHSVVLTGLKSQTTYHYRVQSTDYWGNSTISPDDTFTTTDVDAPVISGVMAASITESSATIVWLTDSPAQGVVEYGISAGYGQVSTFDTGLATSHSIVLSELAARTTYHFKVKSRDASGLWAVSTDRTFVTGGGSGAAGDDGPAAPLISALTAGEITSSGARIYWSTSWPATTRVEYGLTEEYGSFTAADGELATSHFAVLTDLKSGMTYHYRVISRDADGNETVSDDQTLSTAMGRAPLPSLPGWAWTVIGVTGALAVGAMVVRNR